MIKEFKKQKTILIVEDEISLSNILYDKLESEGFKVLKAMNGKEGLEIAFREHPDLILVDIILPVMDGMSMLKELRADGDWSKNIRVIILTNLNEMGKTAFDSSECNVYEYLVKTDWKLEDIVKKVKKVLA